MKLASSYRLWHFIKGRDIKGYALEGLDSNSNSNLSIATAIFTAGGDSGGNGKEKEGSGESSEDGLHLLVETMMEGWQELAASFGKMTDDKEGCMVVFLLSMVSNNYRMEPTQVVWLGYGLSNDCVAVRLDKIEI